MMRRVVLLGLAISAAFDGTQATTAQPEFGPRAREDSPASAAPSSTLAHELLAHVVCARSKTEAGDVAGGAAGLRAALAENPRNVIAQNELAWLLATCPEPSIRDGEQARALAQNLVARSRRANWLDTLAAAYAEIGDFESAIAAIVEVKAAAQAPETALLRNEIMNDPDRTLEVYRQGISYAEGAARGLILSAQPARP